MIDDIKGGRSSAAGKEVSTRNPRSGWRTVLLVLGALAALGMLCMIVFPKLRRGVKDLLEDQGRYPGTGAYIGMAVQDLTKSMAITMGLESTSGVVVTSVARSSPADVGGLKTGDVVLRFDGTRVEKVADLEKLVAAAAPGDTYSIVVDRRDQERTFYVELAQRPTYLMHVAMGSQTELDSQWGCTLSPLTPDLIGHLSLPASITGVAVVAVEPTGLSKSAGMLPGDVIVSVNREPTPDLASFYRAIEGEQNLVLEVYRDGESVYLQVDASSAAPPLATIAGSVAGSSSLPQRVAVAADGNGPSAPLSLRFGTAPYFIIADLSTDRFVAVQNEIQAGTRGFGITAALLVAAQGAGATISIAYGPQAYDALKLQNVVPYTAEAGTVSGVLQMYRSGLLTELTQPTLPGYGYARSIMATAGGSGSSGGGGSSSDDEEQSGYKGMPYAIPPKGKYDPLLDPANALRATGGSSEEDEEQSGYKGMPYAIPPKGQYDPLLDPAGALQAAAGSSQRSEYCYCPICQKLYPHPPSISCAELTCPECGNRLRNWDPGSGTLVLDSGMPLAGSSPSNTGSSPFAGSPFANAATPRLPSTGGSLYGSFPMASPAPMQNPGQMRMGSTGTSAGTGILQGTAGTLYLNQQAQYCYCPICKTVHEHPPGVPCSSLVCSVCGSRLVSLNSGFGLLPVAQTSAGMVVVGKPEAIPPMGQVSAGTAALWQVAASTLPSTGTQTPFQGTPQRPSYAGAAKGQRDLDLVVLPTGQASVGIIVGGPTTIPPMGQITAGMPTAGMPTAGMPIAGMPIAGMPTAGMPTAGMPTAGMPIAGMPVGGKPETIPPMGQTSAGIMVAGPSAIPPGGPRPSGSSTGQASAGTVVAGRPVAGTLGTSPSTGLLQGTLDGECVCPRCGTKVPHARGTACYTIPCPRCGTPMIRDGAVVGQLGMAMARTTAGDAASSAVTIAGDDSGNICIATSGPSMSDQIAPMFDRAPYFMIVGLGTCKVVANPNVDDQAGVGIQSAQLVVSEGAKAVITNDISVKALEELSKLRIRVYTGVTGTAKQGLEWYQNGRLTPSSLDEGNHDEEHGGGSSKGKGSSSSTKKL